MKKFYKKTPSSILVRLFATFGALAFGCSVGLAQVWNGYVWLRSQAEVDSFPLKYGHAQFIAGSLSLGGSQSDIRDLSPLSSIRKVAGALEIFKTKALKNLHGLDQLDSVGFAIAIEDNQGLVSLEGLHNLRHPGIAIYIYRNDSLESLHGLRSIGKIGADEESGELRVQENPRLRYVGMDRLRAIANMEFYKCGLESLDGLDSLETGGYLFFSVLPRLKSVSGLKRLRKAVGLGFVLCGDSLQNFAGLCAESSETLALADKLWVIECHGLQDLSGMEKIDTVLGEAIIGNNNGLLTLDGLDNLRRVGYLGGWGGYDYQWPSDTNYTLHGGQKLVINDNDRLESVAMPNLVAAPIGIDNNPNLKNLDGLENLRFGTIGCGFNAKLSDISGVYNLEYVGEIEFIRNKTDIIQGFNNLKHFRYFHINDTSLIKWMGLGFSDSIRGKIEYETIAYSPFWEFGRWQPKNMKINLLDNAKHGGEFIFHLHIDSIDQIDRLLTIDFGHQCQSFRGTSIQAEFLNVNGTVLPQCDSTIEYVNLQYIGKQSDLSNSFSKHPNIKLLNLSRNEDFGWPTFSEVVRLGMFYFWENYSISFPLDFMSLFDVADVQHASSSLLSFVANPNLRSIDGFDQLQTFDGSLEVVDNDSLTDCRALCHLLTLPPLNRPLTMSGNPFPCDSRPHVLAWCDTINPATERPFERLDFSLAPNPAATETLLTLDGTESGLRRLVLASATGAVLFEQFFPEGFFKDYRLPLGDLPPGQYWVAAYTDRHMGAKLLTLVR